MSTGMYWVTEPDQVAPSRISDAGFGSIDPSTVLDVLSKTVQNYGSMNAMAVKAPGSHEWKYWTWNDYDRDCRLFAKTLIHLGMPASKIVNILGFNSPEWFLALIGSMMAGCIGAGIYSTNLPDACKYISEHSKAEVVVLEGNKQLSKYTKISSELPSLKAIVVYGADEMDQAVAGECAVPVYSWEQFMGLGSEISDEVLHARMLAVQPGHCASLIYTSGTTGPPKAVMISHDNITFTGKSIVLHLMDLNHTERLVSYLPLSHIAAQMIDVFGMLFVGGCTYFADPDALKGTLAATLKEVKPTIFFGVPRVWEKIQEKMVEIGRQTTGIKRMLGTWAKSCGTEHTRRMQYGCQDEGLPWGYGCANALILSKIKEALGLQCTKGCFSAAAPIAPETLAYFASLDIPIMELFGQSECTGPHTVNTEKAWKMGTCGRPLPGTESKIEASIGELCYRGRHIFMGYMYMPNETAATIDEEGWLHSGDVAEFDADNDPRIESGPSGFMRITGRIKELIITAGGENIPPVLIENEMKAAMPAASNCMVVGDKRKFLAMLISLKVEVDADTMLPMNELAPNALFVSEQIGSKATTFSEAREDPLWKKYVDKGVAEANAKATSNAQRVSEWAWLPEDFSEKAGDLTPTLKLKRSVVVKKYADLIDSIYQ